MQDSLLLRVAFLQTGPPPELSLWFLRNLGSVPCALRQR